MVSFGSGMMRKMGKSCDEGCGRPFDLQVSGIKAFKNTPLRDLDLGKGKPAGVCKMEVAQ